MRHRFQKNEALIQKIDMIFCTVSYVRMQFSNRETAPEHCFKL